MATSQRQGVHTQSADDLETNSSQTSHFWPFQNATPQWTRCFAPSYSLLLEHHHLPLNPQSTKFFHHPGDTTPYLTSVRHLAI